MQDAFHCLKPNLVVLFAASCLLVGTVSAQTVIYVNSSAAPSGDGATWNTAYRFLQDALSEGCSIAAAENPVEIWIAEGYYPPDRSESNPNGTGERGASFELCRHLTIYGGFAGGETSVNQRDFTSRLTVLSGDLLQDDLTKNGGNAENSYHVIECNGTNATTVLDGLTIERGNSVGSPTNGGGSAVLVRATARVTMLNCEVAHNSNPSDPTNSPLYGAVQLLGGTGLGGTDCFENCLFFANSNGGIAGERAGTSSIIGLSVKDCRFVDNGHGIRIYDVAGPCTGRILVEDSYFSGNGFGIFSRGLYGSIRSSYFLNNSTGAFLSAGCGAGSSVNRISVSNCVFNSNGTGALVLGAVSPGAGQERPYISFCTFYDNTIAIRPRAIGSGSSGQLQYTNNIFWQNGQISDGTFANPLACNNLTANPLFIDADGLDNVPGTADDDLRLQIDSPAVDSGLGSFSGCVSITIPSEDFLGNPRNIDGDGDGTANADIGAFEYQLAPDIADRFFAPTNGGAADFHLGSSWLGGAGPGQFDNAFFESSGAQLTVFLTEDQDGLTTVHALDFSAARVFDFTSFSDQVIEAFAPYQERPSLRIGAPSPSVAQVFFSSNGTVPLGLVTADSIIGDAGTVGRLNIDGPGASWTASGPLQIGPEGDGRVSVLGEANLGLQADLHLASELSGIADLTIADGGLINIAGIGPEARSTISIAKRGIASISVDSGTLIATDFMNQLIVADEADSVASITILGPSATTQFATPGIILAREGIASLQIQDGALLETTTTGALEIASESGSSASITIDGAGSMWREFAATLNLGGLGDAELILLNGGRLEAPSTGFGLSIQSRGTLRGDGLVSGRVINSGLVNPHSSQGRGTPGNLTIDGDYAQIGLATGGASVSGLLRVELDPAGQSDLLDVLGNAELGGGLVVTAPEGFNPDQGLGFDVFRANTIDQLASRFDVALMPGLSNGKYMRLNYLTDPGRGGSSAVVSVAELAALFQLAGLDPEGVPGEPTAVAVGDLTGNGVDDIAVTLLGDVPGVSDGSVLVLLNNGDGSSFTSQQIAVGVDPVDITLGTLADGGSLDIAITNAISGTVTVLFNDGNGLFGTGDLTTITVGTTPSGIVAGEFTGGGGIDLAVVNAGDNNLRILANNGAGSFTPQTPIPTGTEPLNIATGDLNNDGNADLAVVNGGDNTAQAYFWNPGGFFFDFGPVTPVGDRPTEIDIDDLEFNKDLGPRLSLVVINRDSDEVSIIRGDGTGAFTPAVNLPLGGSPTSVTSFDIEGDGDVDLAITVIEPKPDAEDRRFVRILRNDTDADAEQLVFAPADDVAEEDDPLLVANGNITASPTNDLITLGESVPGPGGRGIESPLRIRPNAISCPGDATGDGHINLADLNLVLANFGQETTEGDTNGDGTVNLTDLNQVLANFGTDCR